jgi:hypothetical protein
MHKTAAACHGRNIDFVLLRTLHELSTAIIQFFSLLLSLAGLIVKPTHHFLWADECLHACGACSPLRSYLHPLSSQVYFILCNMEKLIFSSA